jgi:hypothetical protein
MWEYEHSIETTATPEALWARWTDVPTWPGWNADIEKIEIDGPFAVGAQITMTPRGSDPVLLRLTDVRTNDQFTDEAELDGITVRTTHRLDRLPTTPDPDQPDADAPTAPTSRTRITYRTQITGPAVHELGPQIGPAITADFPDTMAALAQAAGA